jgi:hypothetical protein
MIKEKYRIIAANTNRSAGDEGVVILVLYRRGKREWIQGRE